METSTAQHSADMRLLDKRAEQAARQESARPIADRVDAHGKVRVWIPIAETYSTLWPIDAREQLESGSALLDKPEPDEPEDSDIPLAGDDLDEMTVPELKVVAQDEGLGLSALGVTLKADIIAAIREARTPEPDVTE